MLSANSGDDDLGIADVTSVNDPTPETESVSHLDGASLLQSVLPLTIDAVQLRVEGKLVTVSSSNDVVRVKKGDRLEVVGIDYTLNPSGSGLPGVVAFEGYLRKVEDDSRPGRFDYRDGRFGAPLNRDPLVVGDYQHQGLDGDWDLQKGWDRLSIAMVRYAGNDVEVEDRFFVNLEIEDPDFVINQVKLSRNALNRPVQVGKKIKISASWENIGEGRHFNYSEVDIYHRSDPTRPVWVGTLSGTTEKNDPVSGTYVNTNDADSYSDEWAPDLPGEYILKFHVDPEDVWEESNEANNVLSVTVNVEGPRPQGLVLGAGSRNGVTANDGGVEDPSRDSASLTD